MSALSAKRAVSGRKGYGSNMREHNIVVLKGDGIGPEIVDEAVKVLDAVGKKYGFKMNYDYELMGGCAIDETGEPLPQKTVDACKKADCVFLGAVGGPKWDGVPGIKDSITEGNLDIMIVRELTGGIYFGERGTGVENGEEYAYDTEKYSVSEIKRIAKTAFEMAMKRSKKLTSVDKANVLDSSRLWRKTVIEMSKDYPEVELNHMYVDNCAMQLVRNPKQFDVIVTSNIFGDILSDEASMISGSIGMLASASLSDGKFGLYEPIHGSAPDIAGFGVANPLATILSAAMMLKYSLDESEAAADIENAVNAALEKVRTPDIYKDGFRKVSTSGMGDEVVKHL